MKVRREKRLCYNCNKVYTYGHQCAKKQFYMLEGKDESREAEVEDHDGAENVLEGSLEEESIICQHALTGSMGIQTIRLKGRAKSREVIILVDSGSTHNYLDPKTAKFTRVEVKNTNVCGISSHAKCTAFTWSMQWVEFATEMRLLTLGGCDVVLGMQWLIKIDHILLYAKQLSMSFMRQNKWITLQGIKEESKLMLMVGKMVRRLLDN
ncbi:hypothetical protein Dsin_012958 [Dipteronia sinensis]|uniref:Uncharacterized protein n=1 Tax=Dipteronia sinensis TaxID=43782 RepID=A0AAE0AJH1_9ROSI|nr:hypothetical protein Dsin_012958 [Dipteronia sinensis]